MDIAVRRSTRTTAAARADVGALWPLSLLGLASVGWFVMPMALLATVVVARREGRRGVFGAVVGALAVTAALFAAALVAG